MKKFFCFALCVALCSCTMQTAGVNWYGSVSGSVLFDEGDVKTVTVTLACLDDDEEEARTVSVNSDGSYFFDRVESGLYSLTASAENSVEGKISQTVSVKTGTVNAAAFKFRALGKDSFASDFEMNLHCSDNALPSSRVTVNVDCRTQSAVQVLRFAEGMRDVLFFESGFGTLLSCSQNVSSVQIDKNGTYTFYAKTADAKTALSCINVTGVDDQKPECISGLKAFFSTYSGKMEVSWLSSASEDVCSVELEFAPSNGEGEVQVLTVPSSREGCSFDCLPDGLMYSITACAVDFAGNKSEPVSIEVRSSLEPGVFNAWFDKSRVTAGDGEVILFVSGCNFFLAEQNAFVCQVTGDDAAPYALDLTGSTSAKSTISVPKKAGEYEVKIIYSDSVLYSVRLTVCEKPLVKDIVLLKNPVTSQSQESVGLNLYGQNLDLCKKIEVSVLKEDEVVLTKTASPVSREFSYCEFDSPLEEGVYTVKCTVDDIEQNVSSVLQVCGSPQITKVQDSYAPLVNCGKTCDVVINGKNLNAQEGALSVVCNGQAFVPYSVREDECRVEVFIPYTAFAKDFDITVFVNGEDCGGSAKLCVQETFDYIKNQHELITVCSSKVKTDKDGSARLKKGTELSPYEIAKFSVTRGLYYLVYDWALTNGYSFSFSCAPYSIDDMIPITNVSWRDAVVWCNAYTEWYNANKKSEPALTCVYYSDKNFNNILRESSSAVALHKDAGEIDNPYVKSGANGFRLPTAAEWELAFRGGASSSAWDEPFSGSRNFDEVMWCSENSGGALHEAGQKKPNTLGIYDMSGNVYEWTFSWADSFNAERCLLGGSFLSAADDCKCTSDGKAGFPYSFRADWGFRVTRAK